MLIEGSKTLRIRLKLFLGRSLLAAMAMVSVFALIQPVLAAPEPALTNGSATDITATTATLNATISNAGDSPITSRGFNYGTTNSYGDTANEAVPESFDYVSKFGSASNGDGELYNPYGVAIDSSGDVYVADTTNLRIQKFNSSGVYQSQFGSAGTGNGQFQAPRAIAIDSANNIYVADHYLNRIQKFNSSGVYQSQFGSAGTGNGQFNHPYALAIDSSNNVYVSDRYNHRIQKFNSSGVYQSQFGSAGTGNGQFNQPSAMAFDSGGNVFVVDQSNNRIQKFNSSGVYQSQFGSAGTGNGQLSYPIGISIDNLDNSYVLERGNLRIQKFNSSGVYQSQFGTQGSGDGQFSYPQGIAIDNAGSMYVSDGEDHRIQKFNSSGVYQSQFGHDVDNDQLYFPTSVALNSSNDVFVLDTENHQINKFNSSGVYQSQFGSYGDGDGKLDHPYGMGIDSIGNIYVADTQNSRIQKFNSSGVYQSQFGSYGTSGNGKFNWPTAVAVDSLGNIYVVDTNNHRIQKFNSSGVYQSQFGTQGNGNGQFSYPNGIAIDSAGNVYVVDALNHRIQKFNSSGVYQSQFGTQQGGGNGEFSYPNGIAIDSLGSIYVTDQGNGRFQKFNSSGVYQSQSSSFGDGGLYQPRSISVDSLGDVYVINGTNSEVKKYTKSMHEGDFSADLTGLTCNTTYHYQAYAYNDNGLAQGADATFTTLACPVLEPGPPTNLSASAGSSTSINVIWNEPGSTGDSLIAYYIIYYKKVSDVSWLSINTPDSSTTYALNGLESGTEYAIKIVARNTNNHISVDSSQTTTSTDVYISPLPDPPTNLQATISSSTSIDVSWDAPVNTGDSPIAKYYIYYQKVGDNSWQSLDPGNNNTSVTIAGLLGSTQYNIKVVARNNNNNDSVDSETITATTATPGFYLITDCQQLQDIQNDLAGNYELANNIDCSDTINWNSGAGFQPIGEFQSSYFSGVLTGNNYTISDLYINQDNQQYAFAAPFAATNGALIQDVRIDRPNISALNSQVGLVAGLIGYDVNSTSTTTSVNNVHIINASLQGDAELFVYAAGLIGVSSSSGTTTDSRNEFRGTINIDGSTAGGIIAGGLYGVHEGGTHNVDNSYANADITIDNTFPGESVFTVAGGLLGGNGLIGNAPTQTNFNHSYTSGAIVYNSAQPTGSVALGGIVGSVTRELSIRNTFAHNALTSLQTGVVEGVGGIIAGVYGPDVRTYSNNYFDADQANTTNCIDPSYGVVTDCTVIEGNPTYFYNNTTNAPLNTWDFDNIWQTTNTLPVFGKKALTSITAIPQSRLNNPTPPVGNTPSITELTQKLKDSQTITQSSDQKTTTTPQGENGIIGAIKRFLKNLPEAVVIGFPYVLFSLLLLAAGAMLIQVVINSRRLQATKLLIAKQRAVAEERDTFWHLAANYLRAPITLMVGGVELLSTDKDIRLPAVARLEVFAKNLQKKVFAIMSRIEQSRTLQDIRWPELETGSRVLAQLKFWLPIGLVAFFAILMNLVAKNYRNLSVSSTSLAIQLLIFILVSLLFYWVLSALGMVNRKRKQAEALLEQQSASLDDARTNFIEQSAATLDNDLSEIESQLDSLPANAASMSIVREGAHRLRTLINSFELLVAAQNDKLNTLSPSSSHTQLNTIFDSVIASLNPLIAQKHIRVVKPDFGRVTLPGNSLLLNQVIGSVLSNAVAFSPVGSTIEISLKSHKGDVQLSVTNQGQIIDENQLSQVFRPFMKADGYNALQLDHGGLGVNLYIDSLIMRHLSGAIDVSSDINKGTTMTMRWPTVRSGMAG